LGRVEEKLIINFNMELNESQGSILENPDDYHLQLTTSEHSKFLDYDSDENSLHVEVIEYDIADPLNFTRDSIGDILRDSSLDTVYLINSSMFEKVSGKEIVKDNFNIMGKPEYVRTNNYIFNDEGEKEYINGTFEYKKFFEDENRIVETEVYDLEFILNNSIDDDNEYNDNDTYSYENYIVFVVKLTIYKVKQDSEGNYLFDVYDVPLEIEIHEYNVNIDNRELPEIVTLKDYCNTTIEIIILKLELKFSDVNNLLKVRNVIETSPPDELSNKLKNSLISKLDNTLKSIKKGKDISAANRLGAFKNEVSALRGKKISEGTAQMLMEYADFIISLIGKG
jgi:hypothetical protein